MITKLILIGLLLLAAAPLAIHMFRQAGEHLCNGAIVNITPKGRATRLGDVQFTQRYLLGKAGSDASHIALAGAADIPLGVVTDQTPASDASGDLSYPLPINFFGLNEDTERVIANAAINVGDLIVPAANGRVQTLPIHGNYTAYVIGKALTAASAQDDQIEIIPIFPVATVVPV